jgi:hypothetical protein
VKGLLDAILHGERALLTRRQQPTRRPEIVYLADATGGHDDWDWLRQVTAWFRNVNSL